LQQKIILRADLAKIFIGRYVILNEGVIIKPPFKKQHNQIKHTPVEIGSHVFVDKGTIIQATKIGSCVKIGKDCIIGPRVQIGDCCIVLDGSIVPADAQLASSSVYGGKPAMYMGEIT
jgi:dynactin-5